MRALISLLIIIFSNTNLMASDYCFEKYGLEMDRNGLKYQYSVSDGRFSKELSFRSDKGLLSVLVFEKKSSQDKIAEKFELLLASKYKASARHDICFPLLGTGRDNNFDEIQSEGLITLVNPNTWATSHGSKFLIFFCSKFSSCSKTSFCLSASKNCGNKQMQTNTTNLDNADNL